MPSATQHGLVTAFGAALLAAGALAGCGSGDDQPAAAEAAATTASTAAPAIVRAGGAGDALVAIPRVVTVSMRCLPSGKSVEIVLAVPEKNGASLRVQVPAAHKSFTLQPGKRRALRTDVPGSVAVKMTQRIEPATRRLELRVSYRRLRDGEPCVAWRVSVVQDIDSHAR